MLHTDSLLLEPGLTSLSCSSAAGPPRRPRHPPQGIPPPPRSQPPAAPPAANHKQPVRTRPNHRMQLTDLLADVPSGRSPQQSATQPRTAQRSVSARPPVTALNVTSKLLISCVAPTGTVSARSGNKRGQTCPKTANPSTKSYRQTSPGVVDMAS